VVISRIYKTYLVNDDFQRFISNIPENYIYAVEFHDNTFDIHDVFKYEDGELQAIPPSKWGYYKHSNVYELSVPDENSFDFLVKLANHHNRPIVLKSYSPDYKSIATGVLEGIIYPIRSDNDNRIVEYIRFYYGNDLTESEFNKIADKLGIDKNLYDSYLLRVVKRW